MATTECGAGYCAEVFEVPFDRVHHFARIRIGLPDGASARFLVDTGIGITIVSTGLARSCDFIKTGDSYTGHRMSGRAVEVPLVELPSLELRSASPAAASGGFAVVSGLAGIADLGATDGPEGFDGIIGLDLLGELILTIDPFRSVVGLGALPASAGAPQIDVPVRVRRDGPAVDLRTDLQLPDGTVTEVEIDTGSAATILDDRFMKSCAVDGTERGRRTDEGIDETGHDYVRRFVPIEGDISIATAPETVLRGPTVMFQDIALNGLIGTEFLDRYVQTYDIGRGVMALTTPVT